MAKNTNTQEEHEPSEAEIKEMRDRMLAHYDEEIPMLQKQLEYEKLVSDIEEARLKRVTMTMRIAQIMAGPPQQQETPPAKPEEEKKQERQLKKETA